MAEFSILPDKGITFVEHDVLTQALARIVADESISGVLRALSCLLQPPTTTGLYLILCLQLGAAGCFDCAGTVCHLTHVYIEYVFCH